MQLWFHAHFGIRYCVSSQACRRLGLRGTLGQLDAHSFGCGHATLRFQLALGGGACPPPSTQWCKDWGHRTLVVQGEAHRTGPGGMDLVQGPTLKVASCLGLFLCCLQGVVPTAGAFHKAATL